MSSDSRNTEVEKKMFNAIAEKAAVYEEIDFAILFGSYALGKATALSDIDLGFFFNRDLSLLELGGLVSAFEAVTRKKIEITVLNNLYRKEPAFCFEIISSGKLLYCKDQTGYIEFKKNTYLRYLDTQWLREQTRSGLKTRIETGRTGERNYVG